MLGQKKILDVDCKLDHLDIDELYGFADGSVSDDGHQKKRFLQYCAEACVQAFSPQGVYKLFNPAVCTLPPNYLEPAIKLIGTVIVLRGRESYEKMRRAHHCVLMATILAPQDILDEMKAALCKSSRDQRLFDACCSFMIQKSADIINAEIIQTAAAEDLYCDDRFIPKAEDFSQMTKNNILFYLQAEKRLGLSLFEGELLPYYSDISLVGMYDKDAAIKRRACAKCRYRGLCSIRAIGMTCHGRKGKFVAAKS